MSIEPSRSRPAEVGGDVAVVDRLVHAHVVELPPRRDRRSPRGLPDQVVDVNEVAFQRPRRRHRGEAGPCLLRGILGIGRRHKVFPVGAAEDVVAEGQRVAEVVLLHDPRRAQAAAIDAVLDAVLLQHHLLEHLRESVAAGIGAVRGLLGDRSIVAIEEMPDAGVAADQNELARGRLARNASSSQNSPFTVTSITVSGISLQVARWTTWVTPAIAASATARSEMSPLRTSTRSVAGSERL